MAQQNWFEANPGKAKLLLFLVGLLSLEAIIRILVGVDLLPYERYPTESNPSYNGNIDPIVGTWRYPNVTTRHQVDCIDVVYETNSAGAIDRERSLRSSDTERAIVLGDSFLAGFGPNRSDRVSDLLEQWTGTEHINFASPDFGTIQEWLVYEHYASKYDHSRVLIFILPQNDFDNNDPAKEREDVYEPFLRKTDAGYEVYYKVEFENRFTGERSRSSVIKNTIDNSIYTANVLRWAMRALKGEYRQRASEELVADYDDYTQEDLDVLLYSLDQIAGRAGGRPLHIFTVPSDNDFHYAQQNGPEFRLTAQLEAYAANRENIFFNDLLPAFLADAEISGRPHSAYTLGCDFHWGPLGNEIAARAVQAAIYGPNAVTH